MTGGIDIAKIYLRTVLTVEIKCVNTRRETGKIFMENRMQRKNKGFTAIELMVVLGIIAILSGIAIPSILSSRSNAQLRSASRDVYLSLQKARATAIKRNVNCGIAFNQALGGTTYDYVIFLDSNADMVFDAGSETTLEKKKLSDQGRIRLDTSQGGGNGVDFVNGLGNPAFYFSVDGFPKYGITLPAWGSVYLTDHRGKTSRISVTAAGNIKVISTS